MYRCSGVDTALRRVGQTAKVRNSQSNSTSISSLDFILLLVHTLRGPAAQPRIFTFLHFRRSLGLAPINRIPLSYYIPQPSACSRTAPRSASVLACVRDHRVHRLPPRQLTGRAAASTRQLTSPQLEEQEATERQTQVRVRDPLLRSQASTGRPCTQNARNVPTVATTRGAPGAARACCASPRAPAQPCGSSCRPRRRLQRGASPGRS